MSRDRDEKTPADSPKALTLERLVRNTPARPLSKLDVRLARYQSDLDSIPPPPLVSERLKELHDADKVTQSGSWIIEDTLNQALESRDRVHAIELMRERDLRLEAEKVAEVAEQRLAKQREWWADLAKSIIGPLVVAAIIGVAAIIYEVILAVHPKVP